MAISFGKKAHKASKLIEFLYQKPIISIGDITEPLEMSKPTANSLVKEFEDKGILREITNSLIITLYLLSSSVES